MTGAELSPRPARHDPIDADEQIARFRSLHLTDYGQAMGIDVNPSSVITITGQSGTLQMTWTGNTWSPSASPDLVPRAALTGEQIEARRTVCQACTYRMPDVDRCRLMGCSCTLTNRTTSPWATCPRSLWP